MRRLFGDIFARGDFAAIGSLVAENVDDHDPRRQSGGIEGTRYLLGCLYQVIVEPRFKVVDILAEGDRVAVRWLLGGGSSGAFPDRSPAETQEDTGIAAIFRMENGKIVKRWAALQA